MQISVFDSLGASVCKSVDVSWQDLVTYLHNPPQYPDKHSCPLLKLARFGTTYSDKGSLRHDANMLAICGVEGDHDDGTMGPKEAAFLLSAAGIAGLIYTTASHTEAAPRWRALVPTSQEYAPAAHRELVGRLNGVFRGQLKGESFTLSQAFYFGTVPGMVYEVHVAQGRPIDLVPNLLPIFPQFRGADTDGSFALDDEPVPEWRGPTDDGELLRRAMQSRSAASTFGSAASFADLWECNTEVLAKVFPDDKHLFNASQADAALVAHLSFWTGKHGERIRSLMLQSKLARDKWNRDDYLPRTISRILAAPGEVLTDKVPEMPAGIPAVAPGAPSQIVVTGQTFLGPAEQKSMFNGCVYVQDRHRVLVPGGHLLKPEGFRVVYGGHVFSMDTINQKVSTNAWEAFTESQALRPPRADGICFRPDLTPGEIVNESGRSCVNTWWPANVARQVGDPSPFLTHLRKVLPNERDAELLLSYMCACVQHKGIKFDWWPVLQGAEGNGKTLFSLCVAMAIGQQYVHWPKAKDIASQFNGWLAKKVFIGLEELHDKEQQDEIIENLKTIITGSMGIQIQYKGVDQESQSICCNGMATTNYKTSVRKTPDNMRRLGVFFTAQQTFADIERDGMGGDYFPKLYNWLKREGGFAIVSELLHTRAIAHEFNPAGAMHRAPITSSTDAAIVESRGSVEQQIAEAISQETQGFMGGWVSSHFLDRLISDTLKLGNKISLAKRRDMLYAMGYVLHPGLADGRPNNAVSPDGRKPQLFVLATSADARIVGAADIARAYTAAQQINPTVRIP